MLDQFHHALGVLCLLVFAGAGGLSVYAMISTIVPKWHRIVSVLFANHDHPVTPAASSTPHVDCTPSRRGVEAAAGPAAEVLRG